MDGSGEYEIKYVDVFTTRPFEGNSVGVISGADGFSTDEMYRIAAEINLSESTFVSAPQSGGATARIRFFTPEVEYELSGHAMIGTCFVLAEEGLVTLEEGVTRAIIDTRIGPVPVEYRFERSRGGDDPAGQDESIAVSGVNNGILRSIMMQQTVTDYRPADIDTMALAKTLGIEPGVIMQTGLPMEVITNGLIQLIVPVDSRSVLSAMNPDLIKLQLMTSKYGVQTVDVFTLDSFDDGSVTYSRHFSPGEGLWEDPGSGTGAVSIATYLARHGVIRPGSHIMRQGKETDSLCNVQVKLPGEENGFDTAWVGGLAVTSIKRKMSMSSAAIMIR